MRNQRKNNLERGTAMVEFAITASFFLMMIMAIISGGHLFFTHNALVESTRRGARYAANQCRQGLAGCADSGTALDRIQKVTLYGTPTPAVGASPLVNNLQASNVIVEYSDNTAPAGEPPNDFGVARGTVSVKVVNYNYTFAVAGKVISMPPYQTTVMGESAGLIPGVSCP